MRGMLYNMSTGKPWRASDIDDDDFLATVQAVNDTGRWAMTLDLDRAFPGVPMKVLLAKATRLIRRGLMDGCTCGCRGDFTVYGYSGGSVPMGRAG